MATRVGVVALLGAANVAGGLTIGLALSRTGTARTTVATTAPAHRVRTDGGGSTATTSNAGVTPG